MRYQGYIFPAPHKTGAGRGNPTMTNAHNRAKAVFLCAKHSLIRIMVGRAGQPQGWPGSLVTGISTPVRLTTLMVVESLGGELLKLTSEDAVMATTPALSHPEVTIKNGRAVTTSVAISEFFGKRHDNVIQKIKLLDCSAEFTALNFKVSEYTDSTGRKLPMYQITKNGFVFLVMGFTGKKAAAFKEAYIAEFDRMENALNKPRLPSVSCNAVEQANEANLAYQELDAAFTLWNQKIYPHVERFNELLAAQMTIKLLNASMTTSKLRWTMLGAANFPYQTFM
ncbi:transcriptional regulator [Salmonella enterica subsp. enterica]|nr:transcriptional regulator [Salmonella enterica subsp. enterica]EKS4154161.1 Rha family transcriptional regulator [Salmonella enterica]